MKLAVLNNQPEIFYSIQGEGASMGKPAIFVRLSLCNLHCTWCDTDYTWNWKSTPFTHDNDQLEGYSKYDKSEWITEISNDEIIDELKKYPCKRVIITGGEPLMQQKELVVLLKELKSQGYFIEIETNGTLEIKPETEIVLDQINISPKLSNSNNELKLRIKDLALKQLSKSTKATFKFVVDTPEDLSEVEEIITNYSINNSRVYLMPQGTKPEVLKKKQHWLIDICKEKGFNFSDRLHIHLYGDKRGV